MGTAKSTLFTVSSIMMIVAAACSFVASVLIFLERFSSPGVSKPILLATIAATLVFSGINLFVGISGIRTYNKRTNSSVVIRFPEISVFICVIAIILAFFNGIIIWHFLILIFSGVIIPAVFIYAAVKKSYL